MEERLYSIRMRAVRGGEHLCGAERLAGSQRLDELASLLVRRALEHPRGRAESLNISVDAILPGELVRGTLPPLSTLLVDNWRQGRRAALGVLKEAGVSERAAQRAAEAIAAGASPEGTSMRGAMLVDALSGDRLEPDRAAGVRASRMDITPEAEEELRRGLARLGLDNLHVREALVLAAKVLAAPGVVAELCWSDDPDYTAGYVGSPGRGYVRFPHLKPVGEERGGRAFFLRPGQDIEETIEFLRRVPVLFDAVGELHPAVKYEERA